MLTIGQLSLLVVQFEKRIPCGWKLLYTVSKPDVLKGDVIE
jgi:hypothetical protein